MGRFEITASRASAVAAVLLSAVPGVALAQACLGVPIRSGQFALDGGVTMYLRPDIGLYDEGGTEVQFVDYGLSVTGMRGAVTAGIGYTFSNILFMDEAGHDVNGHVGFELSVQGISICPHVGAGHLRASQDNFANIVNITQSWGSAGFGIGGTITAGRLTLFAVPQYWYLRETENFEPDFVSNCAGAPAGVAAARILVRTQPRRIQRHRRHTLRHETPVRRHLALGEFRGSFHRSADRDRRERGLCVRNAALTISCEP